MTTDGATIEAPPEDAIYFLPPSRIHPDPEQPRANADPELAASIKEQGVHQAITVRPHPTIADDFIIVDGERRWRGSVAVGAKEIPVRIRLDLEDPVDRMVVQVTTATGKPLSPIEQARAFKQMLEADPTLTHAKLADRLGIPKSTVGDRIRLLDIHPKWIELIVSGKLQLSHAPALHRLREVPEKFQIEAVERLLSKGTGYGLGHDIERGEPIRVDSFESKLRDCFRPFMRTLADVPGYDGPTVELKDWDRTRKYAVDPNLWKPIRNAQIKRAREKRAKHGGDGGSSGPQQREQRSPSQVDIERLAASGGPAKETKKYHVEPEKGETLVFSRGRGWADGIDGATLLATVDRSKLAIRKSTDKYSTSEIVVTTDAVAVENARSAYTQIRRKVAAQACAKTLAKLTDDVLLQYRVAGPGTVALANSLGERIEDAEVIGLAIGLDVALAADGERSFANLSIPAAEKLLSALAAIRALDLKIPALYQIDNAAAAAPPRFALPEPKSKTQQKREARAQGEKVGDPSRAPAPAPKSPPSPSPATPTSPAVEPTPEVVAAP